MYQFTTTNIINSNLDSNGTTPKYVGTTAAFTVARVGKFLPANITSIYKRPYHAGVKEVAQVTIPVITAGLVARLEIDVRLAQQTNSEYANTYLYFKKPVTVEVLATGNATTDAAALAAQINSLKDRFGFSYITATSAGAIVTLTATDFNQRFFSVKILKEDANWATSGAIFPAMIDVTAGTFSVTVAGVLGFGDDDWMARSIVIPTLENTRYFGISKDERPVIGGNYTQYSMHYKVQKDITDGIEAEGFSITHHIFYVKSDLVASFENALLGTYPGMITIAGDQDLIITGDAEILVGGTSQLTVANGTAPIAWVSATPGVATVGASTGLVTGVAAGTSDITATDAAGKTSKITVRVA